MKLRRSDLGHRPFEVRILVSLLLFLGVTAVAGGVALLSGVEGAAPPDEWLADIPAVDSWVAPGLVLLLGFGIGSLLAAYGISRRPHWDWIGRLERITRHHWSETAAVGLGAGQLVWIGLELVYLEDLSWLQPLYGAVGLAIALLAVAPSTRGYLALPVTVRHVGAEPAHPAREEGVDRRKDRRA